MTESTRSLVFGTDSRWEQIVRYSADPQHAWRTINVRAHLSWPDDFIVNGKHKASEMNWRVEIYDNSVDNALGHISFQKDEAGSPACLVVLSLKAHGFEDLWGRVSAQLLQNVTLMLDVEGVIPPDDEHGCRWLTSKAQTLPVKSVEFRIKYEGVHAQQGAPADVGADAPPRQS